MKLEVFTEGPGPLPVVCMESFLLASELKDKQVVPHGSFTNDGQFKLMDRDAHRAEVLDPEITHLWSPSLLGRDPLRQHLWVYDGGPQLDIYEYPETGGYRQSVGVILPAGIRAIQTSYPFVVNESGFALRRNPLKFLNVLTRGFYDKRGILIEPVPEEVDHELLRVSQGQEPAIFSTLPFIRIPEGQSAAKVIELKFLSDPNHFDMVALSADNKLVPRRLEYPLDPKRWQS